MRLPRVRLTVRRMMLAVAVVCVVMAWSLARQRSERAERYRELAEFNANYERGCVGLISRLEYELAHLGGDSTSPAAQDSARGIEDLLVMARDNSGERLTAKDQARRFVHVVPPARIEVLARQGRGLVAYYSEMGRWYASQRQAYMLAARSPWMSVNPGPPPDLYSFVRHE